MSRIPSPVRKPSSISRKCWKLNSDCCKETGKFKACLSVGIVKQKELDHVLGWLTQVSKWVKYEKAVFEAKKKAASKPSKPKKGKKKKGLKKTTKRHVVVSFTEQAPMTAEPTFPVA